MSTVLDITQDGIDAILAKYPTKRSAVLPLCLLAQKAFGFVGPEAVRHVAAILELDPTEVKGIVSFYALLREKPGGRFVIQVCNDLPCALRGADQFVEHVCDKLGVRVGDTTDDGLFTVETVMCVAACAKAPVAQIDSEHYENLDPETFSDVVAHLRDSTQAATDDSAAARETGGR